MLHIRTRSSVNQSRLQSFLSHSSVVSNASNPSLPDRYVLSANRYGVLMVPHGGRTLSSRSPSAKRGIIKKFSLQSRRRMMRRLSFLHSSRVAFITLTYPHFPDAEKVKRDIKVFSMRLLRRFPRILIVWRIERQKRGSWHVHLLIYGMPYLPWFQLATMWVEVAGLERHCIKTSTHIRFVRGGTRALMSYLSKYMAKLPDADSSFDECTGRHWGVVGRKNEALYWQSYTLIVSARQYYSLRRIIRRLRNYQLSVTFRQFVWGVSELVLKYFGIPLSSYYLERLPSSS